MDFKSGQELLTICEPQVTSRSYITLEMGRCCCSLTPEQVDLKLKEILSIMRNAVNEPLNAPKKSIGGLIGGEAKRVADFGKTDKSICGSLMSMAISYSMAVLEVNASMGLIVAAPTAGSSGVLPGVLLALKDARNLTDDALYAGLLNASALGYLLMRNASVSGAEAGCQAEVGAASAMAASAVVEIMGGTPAMCLQAAVIAISNLLGMVCDPIAGLVESPCQSRNSVGAANAVTCAELALAGVTHPIPFDEMADAMLRVGRSIPFELRETAMGGCAGTPTGCALGCDICR